MNISVIIPAAGLSRRMNPAPIRCRVKGFEKRKPFILLRGEPVISYTLDVFKKIKQVKQILLVVNKKDLPGAKKYFQKGIVKVIAGGVERKDSVYNGIKALNRDCGTVLIHDGVRPFVNKKTVLESIQAAQKYGAAVVAVPVIPTVKRVDEKGFVISTLNRKFLWEIQTPQAFRREIIVKAYNCRGRSRPSPTDITDDAMLVERIGYKVKIVMGSYDNIKITTPKDLKIAESILCV